MKKQKSFLGIKFNSSVKRAEKERSQVRYEMDFSHIYIVRVTHIRNNQQSWHFLHKKAHYKMTTFFPETRRLGYEFWGNVWGRQ